MFGEVRMQLQCQVISCRRKAILVGTVYGQSLNTFFTLCCPSTMLTSDSRSNEKIALIKENLTEILNPEVIERVLAEGRNPRIYWGG